MQHHKTIFSCESAKQIDLVDWLGNVGHQPQKIKFPDYWYISPLRDEKTPSFKINRLHNVWFDHGSGEGGNIIDLAIKLFDCTVKEFLDSLSNNELQFPSNTSSPVDRIPTQLATLEITNTQPLHSTSLLHYMQQRSIPLSLACHHCEEVRYQCKGRHYYAIGFKNDRGGYELRNAIWKNSSSPKGITTIHNGSNKVAVFEGFFDYLSFLVIHPHQTTADWNFCVLNSLSFFEKSRQFLEQHASIHLFLDNDAAGQHCSQQALQSSKIYVDESRLYQPHKDLNEWLTNMGKSNSQRRRQDKFLGH